MKASSWASAIRMPGGGRAGAALPEGYVGPAARLNDGIEVEAAFGHVGERGETRFEIVMLARLHEAEMTLRQRQALVAPHAAENRNLQRRERRRDEALMPVAGHAVQHHAADAHARVMGGEAVHQCGGGLGLSRHVDHEQHRHGEARRKIGRGTGTARARPECRRTGPWPLR